MSKYEVFLYNIPKVSEDGTKSLPIDPHQRQEFTSEEDAQKCSEENKGKFDRVILIHTDDESAQKMIKRFRLGVAE